MSEQTEATARIRCSSAAIALSKMPPDAPVETVKALTGEMRDALDAYRTAILGSQAALVAQLTEALESVCGVLETVLEVQHAEYHGGDDDWKTCTGSAVCEKGLELLLRAHMILKSAADAQKSADG